MSKEKKSKKKEKKKQLLTACNISEKYKSKCCEKYLKSEKKRCKRCPMFDMFNKAS